MRPTEGPWRRDLTWGRTQIRGKENRLVADTGLHYTNLVPADTLAKQNAANAVLVERAWDMERLLRELVGWWEDSESDDYSEVTTRGFDLFGEASDLLKGLDKELQKVGRRRTRLTHAAREELDRVSLAHEMRTTLRTNHRANRDDE